MMATVHTWYLAACCRQKSQQPHQLIVHVEDMEIKEQNCSAELVSPSIIVQYYKQNCNQNVVCWNTLGWFGGLLTLCFHVFILKQYASLLLLF